jgi:hypothetical protein
MGEIDTIVSVLDAAVAVVGQDLGYQPPSA